MFEQILLKDSKLEFVRHKAKIIPEWSFISVNISYDIFYVEYATMNAKVEAQSIEHKNIMVTWFSQTAYVHDGNSKGLHL